MIEREAGKGAGKGASNGRGLREESGRGVGIRRGDCGGRDGEMKIGAEGNREENSGGKGGRGREDGEKGGD